MTHLNLYLLGTPRIEQAHSPVEIRRQKTLALLIPNLNKLRYLCGDFVWCTQ